MKYVKKIIGDRIYLSPKTASDEEIEKFTEWMNDFDTTDYTGRSSQTMSYQAEKEYLEKHIKDEASFAIVTIGEDKLIGTVGLENIHNVNRVATLGIFIGDKNYRSNGYGAEAIRLLLDYGFNYMNLNNIKLDVISFNERAIKCYKKCGFKEYGRRRECVYINGKYYDIISMDILKREFEEEYIRNKNIK